MAREILRNIKKLIAPADPKVSEGKKRWETPKDRDEHRLAAHAQID